MVILSIVIAERPVQNISRTQSINYFYGIDRDLTCVLRRTIDDGPLTTGNRPIAHALTSQIRQNSIFLTSIGRRKLLGANRDVNPGEQVLHALLPTASIEYDRNCALPGLLGHFAAGV